VIAAVAKALDFVNGGSKIIPGHGPVVGRTELEAWHRMLMTLKDRVKAEIAAGKTMDQVFAAKLTEPYAKAWPGGHEGFVRMVYQELSGK
jgi:hypothetical protein